MQEVIVYRNPAEAALLQLLGSANLFPVICGIFVFFVVFITTLNLFTGKYSNGKRGKIATNVSLVLGVVSGAATIWWMW